MLPPAESEREESEGREKRREGKRERREERMEGKRERREERREGKRGGEIGGRDGNKGKGKFTQTLKDITWECSGNTYIHTSTVQLWLCGL